MAECHPVGFQWVMEAKRRGATIIHVDPRFTRTSAVSDLHVPIRAGTDIVFLGALINHVVSNDLYFKEYVAAYTNGPTIVDESFVDTEDLDGLFSGFDPERRAYDTSSWQYAGSDPAMEEDVEGGTSEKPEGGDKEAHEAARAQAAGSGGPAVTRKGERDETLQHPNCAFQILKRHFARYTPEMVQEVCGISPEQFAQVADALTRNSGRERTTAFCYAVGWTQHSVGVQNIRAAAILQLLLGNVGRPGGGIMALRGHASIQGSSDIPTLFNLLPGYLPMPNVDLEQSLDGYLEQDEGKAGFWGNSRAYMVSLMKAYWGDKATAENDFCFDYLPRISGDHSSYSTVVGQIEGRVKGYFLVGENPAVGSSGGRMQRLGLANLDWLVVRDLQMIESASFWKDGPEIATGEQVTEDIGTEVFFMPAASHVEKAGTFTNTQRMLQWREKAVEPPGDSRSELQFYYELGQRIREKLKDSTDEMDRPILDLAWDYPVEGDLQEPSSEAVLREINGTGPDGRALSAYTELKADGSTSCGSWIYCGVYADGVNQAARRKPAREQGAVASEWGWAWPLNRRMLYNRASADPDGKPWSERKKYVYWDEAAGEWTGPDVPDFEKTKRPDYVPPEGAKAQDALAGNDPFVMQGDGKAWLFAPVGLIDGPMPTHYEPAESPFRNRLHGQQANPTRKSYEGLNNVTNPSPPEDRSEVFPHIFTTSRLTEHHTAGGMSRYVGYLAELQPEMFVEVSPQLAAEIGLEHLGWCHVVTSRSAVEGRVVVTDRLRPLRIDGRMVHQVWLPYHWGQGGLTSGDAANDLVGIALDPNVLIQESKVGTCDVRPGRRPRGTDLTAYVHGYRQRAGIAEGHETPFVTAENSAGRS